MEVMHKKKKWWSWKKFFLFFFIGLLLLGLAFINAIRLSPPEIADHSPEQWPRVKSGENFYRVKNNWLRKSESGLWELYVEGDGFERGVANGKLTKDLALYQEIVFVNQIRQLVPSENYLQFLKYFVAFFNRKLPEHIQPEYLDEIYGVSLSAADEFDHLAPKYYRILNYHSAHDIGHALQDKNMTVGCTSFGVWNKKSADGHLLLARNFDFFAGDDFAKNKIVCFTKPKSGNKFMYVTWSGFTGVVSGMNDKGLALTINAAKSDIPQSAATPISILCKEILQYASTVQEALAIAQSRQTFVSESILIASAKDHKTVVIEKTPNKTNLYEEAGDQLICSNHYRSPLFAKDYNNNKNIVESSSQNRRVRMQQLLAGAGAIDPQKAAEILRNREGINNKDIGIGNEMAINQLIAHHAVIMQPEELLMWVSTAPWQEGKMVCYNLTKVFQEAVPFDKEHELADASKEIPADPFLSTVTFKNYLVFKKIKFAIDYASKSKLPIQIKPEQIAYFLKLNPNSYLTYWSLGDYYSHLHNKTAAIAAYEQALSCEVATLKERRQITKSLNQLTGEK
jgi:tetratricopeptide (TPR) repeat protein